MSIIIIPEKHALNRIVEVNNLSDAKYYTFILLLGDMKHDKEYRRMHLDLVQYDSYDIEEAQHDTMKLYARDNDFKYFVEHCPRDFAYIAKYIDKYMIEVEEGQYKLDIPYNIDVTFEENKIALAISKYKEEIEDGK